MRSRKPRLATARPLLATADGRTVRPLSKVGERETYTPEHKAWALAVKRRAGWRCEECQSEHGPDCRLIADHIVERSDGGALHDIKNGRALCPSCHGRKTMAARARRHGLTSEIAP